MWPTYEISQLLPVQHLTASGKSTDSVLQTQRPLNLITRKLNNTRIIDCKKSLRKVVLPMWQLSKKKNTTLKSIERKWNFFANPRRNGHKLDPKSKFPGTLRIRKTLTQLIFGNKTERGPHSSQHLWWAKKIWYLVTCDCDRRTNANENFPTDETTFRNWPRDGRARVAKALGVKSVYRRGDLQIQTYIFRLPPLPLQDERSKMCTAELRWFDSYFIIISFWQRGSTPSSTLKFVECIYIFLLLLWEKQRTLSCPTNIIPSACHAEVGHFAQFQPAKKEIKLSSKIFSFRIIASISF